jgi:hypothetical protein
MKINKLIAIIILVLLVCMVAWGCWNWLSPKKATPTVDLPVGDDMATQIKKGTTICTTANVPAFVLNGTGAWRTDVEGVSMSLIPRSQSSVIPPSMLV